MSNIGTERLEPTAQIAERLGNDNPREREPRSRRQPAATRPKPEPADQSETTPHQVDSLA